MRTVTPHPATADCDLYWIGQHYEGRPCRCPQFIGVETVQYFVYGSEDSHFLDPLIYELSHVQGMAEIQSDLIFYEVSHVIAVPVKLYEMMDTVGGEQ